MSVLNHTANKNIYKGRSNTEDVLWSFEHIDNSSSNQLSWISASSSSKIIPCYKTAINDPIADQEWKSLEFDRIVAIVGSGKESNKFTIITVTEDPGDDEAKKAHVGLETFEIYDPPSELVELHRLPDHFLPGKLLIFHVVVSVASGMGRAKDFWEKALLPLVELLKSTDHIGSFDAHFTTSEHSITELAKSTFLPAANGGKQQFVIVLSGDGGVIDILNALLSEPQTSQYKRPELALIPLGTGNALANSSGILDDQTHGLRTLLHGRPKGLPMFRANFSSGARYLVDEARHEKKLQIVDGLPTIYGAVVCSWGLHAALVADSDTTEYRKFGAERFKMAAKENLYPADGSLPHEYTGTLSISKHGSSEWAKVNRLNHGYVLATLVSNLEAGFTVNPESKPLDGILRIIHFGPMSGEEAMDVMTKAYQGGKHIEDERVSYEAVSGMRIDFAENEAHWRRICIDGKIVRVDKNGWVEMKTGIEPVIDLIIP